MNILFYGNCQLYAVLHTLNLDKSFNIVLFECWNKINKENFISAIHKSDIIITQPINDNYKDTEYLSTSYIIKNKKHDCKIIIFDSCYFDFYYFDLTYKFFNNIPLRTPCDYHYHKMIECYNNGNSIEYYIDNFVNNLELKTSDELENIAVKSLNELLNRNNSSKLKYIGDNIYFISTYEFVKNNYKDKLLFYSMNHPTKYLIQFICEEIVNILQLQNTINYQIDMLEHHKCILYKCVSKNVNFDIQKLEPLVNNNTNIYKITQLYYDAYKQIGLS